MIRKETDWIDTRLRQEEMDFLRDACSVKDKKNISKTLAGNISKSERIIDKDNWFYDNFLKELSEKMYYKDWENYRKYVVNKEEPPPKFELRELWVNYQKQHEFNPFHNHSGLFSFVIFVKIPTDWSYQHALPFSVNSNSPHASDFAFVWSEKDTVLCENTNFKLSSEDEGRILFFPAWLQHQVYPFYECEEERVTISGNIWLYDPEFSKTIEKNFHTILTDYEQKENVLKMMETSVKVMKKELEQMKKEGEKEGLD